METSFVHTSGSVSPVLQRSKNACPVHDDVDFDNEELEKQVEAGLESFFARQRELMEGESLPDGYTSIEESYRKSINRLNERYA